MNIEPLVLFMFAPLAVLLLAMAVIVLPRRVRMERRARKLLAEHPGAEQTALYLQFRSARWSAKQTAHDAMVAEMAAKGWTFLRASEASPFRTLATWGGGVNMYFIRI